MAKYRANSTDTWKTLKIKALDSMVIGSVIQFVGTTIPNGWLECDGSTITQSAYPELYDLIGGTLPDFRGRVLVGQDTSDTDFDTLLETGGYKGLQKHSHTFTGQTILAGLETGGTGTYIGSGSTPTQETGNGAPATATNGNLQPYAVVKHIIKAKNTTPTMASIVDAYSTSTQDGYSCNFINGVELYSDTTGLKTEITLSETSANFRYIEIYGYASGMNTCIKIYQPNDKSFEPEVKYRAGTLLVSIVSKYTISGNKITPDTTECGYTSISNSGVANFNYDQTNYFYINRVIGYR